MNIYIYIYTYIYEIERDIIYKKQQFIHDATLMSRDTLSLSLSLSLCISLSLSLCLWRCRLSCGPTIDLSILLTLRITADSEGMPLQPRC